jgi:hypothetical protein
VDLREKVLFMLETLSMDLPLFETWRGLFPEAEFSSCMRNTRLDFVAFVVNTINYLRRSAYGLFSLAEIC